MCMVPTWNRTMKHVKGPKCMDKRDQERDYSLKPTALRYSGLAWSGAERESSLLITFALKLNICSTFFGVSTFCLVQIMLFYLCKFNMSSLAQHNGLCCPIRLQAHITLCSALLPDECADCIPEWTQPRALGYASHSQRVLLLDIQRAYMMDIGTASCWLLDVIENACVCWTSFFLKDKKYIWKTSQSFT